MSRGSDFLADVLMRESRGSEPHIELERSWRRPLPCWTPDVLTVEWRAVVRFDGMAKPARMGGLAPAEAVSVEGLTSSGRWLWVDCMIAGAGFSSTCNADVQPCPR